MQTNIHIHSWHTSRTRQITPVLSTFFFAYKRQLRQTNILHWIILKMKSKQKRTIDQWLNSFITIIIMMMMFIECREYRSSIWSVVSSLMRMSITHSSSLQILCYWFECVYLLFIRLDKYLCSNLKKSISTKRKIFAYHSGITGNKNEEINQSSCHPFVNINWKKNNWSINIGNERRVSNMIKQRTRNTYTDMNGYRQKDIQSIDDGGYQSLIRKYVTSNMK